MVITYNTIRDAVAKAYKRALTSPPKGIVRAFERAIRAESNPRARRLLELMLENMKMAKENDQLICSDACLPVFTVKVGTNTRVNGDLKDAIKAGTEKAIEEIPLRRIPAHPITREIKVIPDLSFDILPEKDYIEITSEPVGAGSLAWGLATGADYRALPDHIFEIKKFVLDRVVEAGSRPCPPGVVGVGLGGSISSVGKIAKEASLRPPDERHWDPAVAKIEEELFEAINATGIGPMGLGGNTTVLGVNIEVRPTHHCSLPMAIKYQCWAARYAHVRISSDNRIEFLE